MEDFSNPLAVSEAALARMRQDLHAAIARELQPVPGIRQTLARLDKPVCVAELVFRYYR